MGERVVYLKRFSFPDAERETDYLMRIKRTCYDSFYPFKLLSARGFLQVDCEPVTLLYGGNGSGKTTVLNIIAGKTGLSRDSAFNSSSFFEDYVNLCEVSLTSDFMGGKVITSDDVFDYMLNVRALNEGIDLKREDLFEEYLDVKYKDFKLASIQDYEKLKRVNRARSQTQSRYVRGALMRNIRELSNGESAFKYFTEKIEENGLYLLDEPENSLSPARQKELAGIITDSARFFGCQFIISTHSPFLLAMREARIYDLDADPARRRQWTELDNIREYHSFFREHHDEFI